MSNDNRPVKQPTSQLIFPNAEATNQNQIQNLLNIGSFALHALLRPGDNGATRPELPQNAENAAEKTFIKVLDVFNQMLFDRDRWSLDTQKKLAAQFDEARSLNQRYLEHQAEFARIMTTPHFRFKPSILRLQDGRVLAMLGSVDDLDNAITGVGDSAEEALQRFDETFEHGIPANWVEVLAKREADLEAGKTPEQHPIKNEESTNAVETDGPAPAKPAPKRRKNQSGNR